MPAPPRIETDRLVLTWPTPEQVDDYYRVIAGTDIFDTIIWDGPKGPQDLHDYWAQNRASDPADFSKDLNLAIVDRQSGRTLGRVDLRPEGGRSSVVDVGYVLAPAAHGQGFATEAVGALIDEAFARRGAERVYANIFVGNVASRNVVEKLGFQFEGTQRRVPQGRVW